jgi:hypothetical protein
MPVLSNRFGSGIKVNIKKDQPTPPVRIDPQIYSPFSPSSLPHPAYYNETILHNHPSANSDPRSTPHAAYHPADGVIDASRAAHHVVRDEMSENINVGVERNKERNVAENPEAWGNACHLAFESRCCGLQLQLLAAELVICIVEIEEKKVELTRQLRQRTTCHFEIL